MEIALDIQRRLREQLKAQENDPNSSPYGDGLIDGLKLALRTVDDALRAVSSRASPASLASQSGGK